MSRGRQPPRALRKLVTFVKAEPSRFAAQANGADITPIQPGQPTPDPFAKARAQLAELQAAEASQSVLDR